MEPVVIINDPPTAALMSRIEATGREVKRVDFVVTVMTMVTLLLVFALGFTLLDHWLFRDGLPVWLRVGFCFAGMFSFGTFFLWRVIPLIRYSVNPVFSAAILESHKPSLQNALINWLMLRKERATSRPTRSSPLREKMYEGIAKQAAVSIDEIPLEMMVDHSGVIRWGVILAMVLVVFCAYTIVSPKSPLQSILRLAMPFAQMDAPQRVRFHSVLPGSTEVFQGEHITVTAELSGVGNEPVYLFFTTADRRLVDQTVPMTVPDGEYRYECRFPPFQTGFDQDITYYIGSGNGIQESRSEVYRFTVLPRYTFEVQSVTYRYPEYTGLPPKTVQSTGDMRAIEGTEVLITGVSNFPMVRASIVPDGNNGLAKPMRCMSNGTAANGSLWLMTCPTKHGESEYSVYSLYGFDAEHRSNTKPSVNRIEVFTDKPPTVEWVNPHLDVAKIPVNGGLEATVVAEDEDFGIRHVILHIEVSGKTIPPIYLLQGPESGPVTTANPVTCQAIIRPESLRLKSGDEGEYWVEVHDSKWLPSDPQPNTAVTLRLSFIVEDFQIGADTPDKNPEPNEPDKTNRNPNEEHVPNDQNPPSDQQSSSDTGTESNGGENSDQNNGQNSNQNSGQDNDQNSNQNNGQNSDQNSGRNNGQNNDQNSGRNQGEGQKDPSAKGEKQPPVNPETEPGEAFERILEHLRENDPQRLNSPTDSENNQGENGKTDENSKGENNQGENGTKDDTKESTSPDNMEKNNDTGQSPSPPEGAGPQTPGQGDESGDPPPSGGQTGSGQSADGSESGPSAAGETSKSTSADSSQNNGKNGNGNSQGNNENSDSSGSPQEQTPQNGSDSNGSPSSNNANSDGAENNNGDHSGQNGQQGTRGTPPRNTGDTPDGRQQVSDLDPNSNSRSTEGTLPDKTPRPRGAADPDAPPNTEGAIANQNSSSGSSNSQNNLPQRNDNLPSDTPGRPGENVPDTGEKSSATPSKTDTGMETANGTDTDMDTDSHSKLEPSNETAENPSSCNSPDGQPCGKSDCQFCNSSGSGGGSGQPSGGEPPALVGGGQSGRPSDGSPHKDGRDNSGTGGGGTGSSSGTDDSSSGGGADAANLAFTEKNTNLVLEYLRDQMQQGEPDKELLNRLGWSKTDMARFLETWQKMAQEGKTAAPGSAADEGWKEALRSIGTLSKGQQLRAGPSQTQDDTTQPATQSRRNTAPPTWKERFQNYTKGISL